MHLVVITILNTKPIIKFPVSKSRSHMIIIVDKLAGWKIEIKETKNKLPWLLYSYPFSNKETPTWDIG